MRRVVLVLATMALAILVAGGVAQAIEIEKDRPAYVSFDPTYKSGSSRLTKGTPYLHPKYCIPTPEDKVDCSPEVPTEALVLRELRYDVGVVVLEEPVKMATYGALPEVGLVDTLKEGQRLTTVGYGATDLESGREPPPRPQLVYPDDRYSATVRLLNTKNPAIGEMFVKTTGRSLIRGKGEASCYGDSGGPLFVGDQQTLVGVTSFGIAPLCRGPGYYQRVDLPGVLKWVRSFP
jgi:hypothetical protein